MIPSEYLEHCPRELPPLIEGDKESMQENRKKTQQMYHQCAAKDDALIHELIKQGVKGTNE